MKFDHVPPCSKGLRGRHEVLAVDPRLPSGNADQCIDADLATLY